jgi:hypothetical protein
VKIAKLNLLDIFAKYAYFLMINMKKNKYFIAKNVEFAELVDKKIVIIAIYVNAAIL